MLYKINPTLQELFDEIQDDTDIGNNEDYVTNKQLIGFINRGIRRFEPVIHALNQDYYKSEYILTPVTNQAQYSLPSEIFANKITGIFFTKNATDMRKVKKIKTDEELMQFMTIDAGSYDTYRYMILNYTENATSDQFPSTAAASGIFIRFLPIPTNQGVFIIYYLRNAKKFEYDNSNTDYTQTLDVVDFPHFITSYAKLQVALKLQKWQMVNYFKAELDEIREEIRLALNPAQPDQDNSPQLDDFYYAQQFLSTGVY